MVSEPQRRKVLDALEPDELVALAADLVRINSVWDPEAGTDETEAARFVARWAAAQGFSATLEEAAPGRPNVIVTWGGWRGPRRLMFEGHTDVVTPGDPAMWGHDPFGARIVGRRMYGRGTNDTKGNLAAMLMAMAALKRSGVALQGEIIGGVLCDEEGLMLGVQDFIRRGHADKVTGAIICEPQDGLICCTQKGALRARYTVRGRMSHGAMPLAGLNPVPALARLIDGLSHLEREAMDSVGKDPLLGWPSFTQTVVRAPARGVAQLNVVPGSAELLVDIRTTPNQSHPAIVEALGGLAERASRDTTASYRALDAAIGHERDRTCRVDLEILADRPCTVTDRRDPLVLAVDWATRESTGREPIYAGVPGATDGTYLWAWKGIPIVTIGAGDREVPHQVDEWVDLDQLTEVARIYALSALAYLSAKA
jgi:succinyl-diaminopimelate desuccinylase